MRLWWVVLIAFCASFVGAQPYVIERFDVEMTLSAKAELEVTERIQVVFNESRRGIFRDIPVHYENRHGLTRSLFIDSVSVTDQNGAGETTKLTREGEGIRIRIGDEDVFLVPGTRKTYVIRYRCRGMMNWFEQNEGWAPSAQLYWNVTGDRWDTTIQASSLKVNFPESEGGKDLRARVFVGPYGSVLNQILNKVGGPVEDHATGTRMTLGSREFKAERLTPLGAYEGFTIVLDLPYDAITKPSLVEAALMNLSGMWGLLIPLIILPLGLIAWFKYGRDPAAGVMVVAYDPPDDLSGPEAGTLLDETVDKRDISAAFFSLAIKGHLTIHPVEEGMIFKRRTAELRLTDKAETLGLDQLERQLLGYLKKGGKVIDETDLRHDVAPNLMTLKNTLYGMLVQRGYYRHSPDSARGITFGCGCGTVIATGILFTILNPFGSPIPSLIGGVIGMAIVLFFASHMPKRTFVGARAHDQVKGFEEFMRRAEGDELNWMAEHHPDMAMFEKYLPHAIAFGLAREWAKRFEGVLEAMPDWYVTSGHPHFNSIHFSRDIVSISDSIGSAAATPPRSEGGSGGGSGFSSGGGFSGGGFGGGGGGSW
jgi:uncharacterized membrane protein YgcG